MWQLGFGLVLLSSLALPQLAYSADAAQPGAAMQHDGFLQQTPPNPSQALVYVYRSDSYLLDEHAITLSFNGKRLMSLERHTYSWVYLAPGEYEIRQRWPAEVPVGRDTRLQQRFEGGKTYFLRFDAFLKEVLQRNHPSWKFYLTERSAVLEPMRGARAVPSLPAD
ncbi:DUF2846 domain-containing protein [Massilia sp. W12]|uniref:DUF2846 domain-containing protein n=1 Tax=Massilia sp. W12 TaxID=3126507 RepID=UPI0030CF5C1F